jgi:hypothetical protein
VQVRGSAFLAGLEDRAVTGQVAAGVGYVGEQGDAAGGQNLRVGGADEDRLGGVDGEISFWIFNV